MVVDVKGGHTGYRYFFVIFYYFGVIIGLNIIVAFAIDMYAAVERLEKSKESNKEYLLNLAQKQHSEFIDRNKVEDEDKDGSSSDKSEGERIGFENDDRTSASKSSATRFVGPINWAQSLYAYPA